MSQDLPEPQRDLSDPNAGGPPTSGASDRAEAEQAEHATAGEDRRGIGEWAVVLLLVALIVGVAWSQFGPLFDTSTAGTGSGPQEVGQPAGIEVEADGITLGGTPMSQLGGEPGAESAEQGQPEE